MSVGLRLCLAALCWAAAEADAGGVSFWLTNFTMSCPEEGQWFAGSKEISENRKKLELEYKNRGRYHCKYEEEYYYFYVEGKVCPNCVELDGEVWMAVLVSDLVLTVVVMATVFKCTKRRSSAGLPHTPKASSQPASRSPPVPSSDYERLNPHTLSQGTYSVVHTNRTD